MAAKKLAAKKRPRATSAWTVNANGQEVVVLAAYLQIVDGTLILEDAKGGHLVRAFAPGAWTTVAAKEDHDA